MRKLFLNLFLSLGALIAVALTFQGSSRRVILHKMKQAKVMHKDGTRAKAGLSLPW